MNKISIPILFSMLFLTSLRVCAENFFYYAGSDKYSITLVPNKRAIFRQSPTNNRDNNHIERIGAHIHIANVDKKTITYEQPEIIRKTENGELSLPLFSINNATEVVLLPEIILKPRKGLYDMSYFINKYNLIATKETKQYKIYSVPIDNNVITVANEIYESGDFDFAYPNFFNSAKHYAYIPNDPYFPYQITCHNTGQVMYNGHSGTIDADINAPEAWDITKGSHDIVIAVFDAGVTEDHPDLPLWRQKRLYGSNFGSGNPNNPSPTGDDNHGNACAGVIAATMDNNEGVAGIAPLCRIMPIRWDTTTSPDEMADGITFAVNNGANVISCSWGYENSGGASNLHPVITEAIDNAIAHNVIVIFAAGNTADHVHNTDGEVKFPANANVPYLMAIGASDRYDYVANYSPISYQIDFVAPSHRAYADQIPGETREMWTIDIPGPDGYNPIPYSLDDGVLIEGIEIPRSGMNRRAYTGCFGGTSHSCPVVAGVVALMLSVNPYLTPSEVYDILKETSAKVGGYTYINGRCNEMGYGRIDAYAAVLAAQNSLHKYIQDTTYVNGIICTEQSKELYAGYAVTNNKPYGNVIIQAGSDVTFKARTRIELRPGFRAVQGSTFKAIIGQSSQQSSAPSYVRRRELFTANNEEDNHDDAVIEQPQKNTFSISPNPVSDILNIHVSEELSQVNIYNLNGQCVLQADQTDIDVSALPQGMYILCTETTSGTPLQAKFIKQ